MFAGKAAPGRFEENYTLGALLGRGMFSEVKTCTNKKTQEKSAVKIIPKKNVEEIETLAREVEILSRVRHPNIIDYKALYESDAFVYVITELLTGGELFDRIVQNGSFSEKMAAKTANDMLSGLSYLHSNGIIHRDLKPENLIFASPAEDSVLKLVDFGMSRPVDGQNMLGTVCGTPAYVAPEVFDAKPYGLTADMWAAGIIIYIMLCGFEPFAEDSDEAMFTRILSCTYSFPSPSWDLISQNAKDLVSKLIVLDPAARLSAAGALKHPWVQGQAASSNQLVDTFSRLKEFNAHRKLRGGANAIMAIQRLIKMVKSMGPSAS
eukprot:m.194689 g.194689  ORF g.194689 m.194689 type:complete len:322 (-) comp10075_c2_seq37:87-1052(-)